MKIWMAVLTAMLAAHVSAADVPVGQADRVDPKKTTVPPPPPMPKEPAQAAVPDADKVAADKPVTTIVERENTKFTEYRVAGRLYMIKVEPKVGPAYYLYDENGSGLRPVTAPDNGQHLSPPRWVLFTF
ncbi:DUF2782 domain-containing protein [Burkholderiaceae bacterium DAT-1]|nr:DUF2782 domain-containing protein [Burkholderiaceae bacterium DAT-1]